MVIDGLFDDADVVDEVVLVVVVFVVGDERGVVGLAACCVECESECQKAVDGKWLVACVFDYVAWMVWPVDVVTEEVVGGVAYVREGGSGEGVAEEEKGLEPGSTECERLDKANPHTAMDLWRRAGEEEHCGATGEMRGVKLCEDGVVECGKLVRCNCVEAWRSVVCVW